MSRRLVVCCESRRKAGPYLAAMRVAGAADDELVLVTPEQPPGELERLGAETAGLLLCGGPDMEPWRYGEEPRADANLSLMPELDEIEWRLLTGAAAARRPVWAVCRGLQTVNVFLGGTLWQDIPSQVAGALDHDPEGPHSAIAHRVSGESNGDPWAALLTADPLPVNSRHHQAIRRPGRGVRAVACSDDGLVEAAVVEDGDWWVKGVQWHPENLVDVPLQRRLWRLFLEAAGDG